MKTEPISTPISQQQSLKAVWLPLIKPFQTALLLITGITGYFSARPFPLQWTEFGGMVVALFSAIAGSTILNMVYDRDIDARMKRTAHRPLVEGKIAPRTAVEVGGGLSLLGVLLATYLHPLFGVVVFLGWFLDVVVYTVWLKRRTAWSIVWGGLSGGMPILAGRVLGLGTIDGIGLLLAIAIVLWIPTHILTFNMRFFEDYHRAGIPTFPGQYGFQNTHIIIAMSAIGAALAFFLGCYALGLAWGYMNIILVFALAIFTLAIINMKRQSQELNFLLFKFASIFMLVVMIVISIGIWY